jgi:hypothetical protein
MAKIVLLSCVSKKLDKKAKAEEMYVSPLFKYSLGFAKMQKPDKIFILSAKYGLLSLDEEVEPYNETLITMNKTQRKEWAEKVLKKLRKETNMQEDLFVFLAGERYREFILPHIKKFEIPMKGLGIGRQLKFLKDRVK